MPTRCRRTNKIIFESMAIAGRNAARRRLDGTEGNQTMTAYACSDCEGFHVGHNDHIIRGLHRKLLRFRDGGALTATEIQWLGGPELIKRQLERMA